MSQTGSLSAKLNETRIFFLEQVPGGIKAKLLRNIKELGLSGMVKNAVKTGDMAPDFTLPNICGEEVNLREKLDNGHVVISYYRGEWCPYCSLELRALQDILPEIEALGACLLAISPQTVERSISTAEKCGISFDVLSDAGNQIAYRYGLVFTVDEAIRPIYEEFGIKLDESNGDTSFRLPVPATYIVDKSGIVRRHFVDVDYTKRMEPADLLRGLREIS